MGVFKSYEMIVCCWITPLLSKSGLKLALWVVGLEAREQARSRFFNP